MCSAIYAGGGFAVMNTSLCVVHCCVGAGMDNGSEGDFTTSVVKLLTLRSNSRVLYGLCGRHAAS